MQLVSFAGRELDGNGDVALHHAAGGIVQFGELQQPRVQGPELLALSSPSRSGLHSAANAAAQLKS
jgi:hypothetical protein